MRTLFAVLLATLFICELAFAEEPLPAKVVVAKVFQKELAENRAAIGVLYFERISEVSTEVAGLVETSEVRQGDRVGQGDILVRLNTDILDREIALIRSKIDRATLRVNNSRKNFERLAKLHSRAGVSEKVFDDAQYIYEDAQQEKQVIQKSLEKFLIQKERSVIKAPFAGIILSKNVDSGAWVQQGKQLVKLGSTQDIFARVPVAEDVLPFITLGDTVTVTINAFDKRVDGKIDNVDPIGDVKTKNIFLKVNIPDLPLVVQNMSATVYVDVSKKRKLSVVPRASIVKFQGKDFIYTVKENRASILPVNIVAFWGDKVGVDNSSIVADMVVVVEGNERLRPHQPVEVMGEI